MFAHPPLLDRPGEIPAERHPSPWGDLFITLLGLGAERIQVPVDNKDKAGIAFWANQGWWPARRIYTWSLAPTPRLGWRERFSKAWNTTWEVK